MNLVYFSWDLTDESDKSGLVVLEISLPTGYYIQQDALDNYVRSRQVHTLKRAEFTQNKVVFFFDHVSRKCYFPLK